MRGACGPQSSAAAVLVADYLPSTADALWGPLAAVAPRTPPGADGCEGDYLAAERTKICGG